MKKIAISSAALMLATAMSSVQAQEVYDDRWYVGGALGASVIDEDRLANDDWPYYGLFVGRYFTPNFSVDFRIDRYEGNFDDRDIAIPPGADEAIDLY
ncbi:MAG: outer membrane beta-barrel protein, partial [Pseudomonadota bacterium]